MSMLRGEDEDYVDGRKTRVRFVLGCIMGISAVFLVLLLTFLVNKKPDRKNTATVATTNQETALHNDAESPQLSLSELAGSDGRTSDEMDFWHMYDKPKADTSRIVPHSPRTGGDDRISENEIEEEPLEEEEEEDEEEENAGGNTTISENEHDKRVSQVEERSEAALGVFDLNQLTEGVADFAKVETGIKENTYSPDSFRYDGIWKDYTLNDKRTSFRGIDVSKYQKNINWQMVASSGIDFAMLRMGSRGYNSGRVVIDDEFNNNLKGCSANGINMGVYFYSQAVTPEEAVEEANYCVGAVQGYEIAYPIVFDTEEIINDSYRTESLSKEQMTAIAKAFCDTVSSYGFTPMIGATKKQFVNRFVLKDIEPYDWWLFDTDEVSVFPYRYNMWQYSQVGKVDGIEGAVNLDIAFVDYTVR
ncbi:MAG: glycoside hydrolase family 25 protein [Lachnospiraceae bacterium]|nr:glycoside hydrolase family 25 protein [Lachnospiraceae bacterium]